jgi:ribosomal protein S18 acetylase RimI-like enzyme
MTHPLDNPVYAALTGPQSGLTRRSGGAVRYPADVSPFCALPDDPADADWAAAARLVTAGEVVNFPAVGGRFLEDEAAPPPGWALLGSLPAVQLVADGIDPKHDEEAVRLGPADIPAMLDLTARTKPGPFLPRTIEFGGYLGIRRDGRLIAMAGQRLRPPGHTEISAVCTDPGWRGMGLAARLTLAVAADIAARGDTPFLHAVAANVTAISLYERLGFRFRREVSFPLLRLAEATPAG